MTTKEMAEKIIEYVLIDPDDPPAPEKLLEWIISMGFQIKRL